MRFLHKCRFLNQKRDFTHFFRKRTLKTEIWWKHDSTETVLVIFEVSFSSLPARRSKGIPKVAKICQKCSILIKNVGLTLCFLSKILLKSAVVSWIVIFAIFGGSKRFKYVKNTQFWSKMWVLPFVFFQKSSENRL